MKNKISTLKRHLLITVLMIIPGIPMFSLDLNVSQSGTLSSLLTEDQKANTEKLVLTTSDGAILNEADFATLSAMPSLKELDLSGDLNTEIITVNAFAGNAILETIKFPANMKEIGTGAFNNSALKGVVSFPKTLISQETLVGRFTNCQGITAFEFPDNTGLSSHEGVAYAQGGTLLLKYPCGKTATSYAMPDGVTTIGEQAFFYNHKLEELILSESFNGFATTTDLIFGYVTGLKRIEVKAGNPNFASIEGILLNAATKEFMYFPPANDTESLVVDGSLVERVPMSFFSYASSLKRVVFTEGFKSVGYRAFRQATLDIKIPIEYVELPSTIETIDGEAFNSLGSTIQQFVCKATTPPRLTGNATFRESNGNTVKFAVPASAHAAYLTSQFVNEYYPEGGGGSFTSSQIVTYSEITVSGGTAVQNYSAAGYSIKIVAEDAPGGKSFSRWESATGVVFVNESEPVTYFRMPNNDVTITAVFEEPKPYTITGATISTSGTAALGTVVPLQTGATKVVDGATLYFKEWKIIRGEGIVIGNPKATTTYFTMVDGEVAIEAVYDMMYMIDITRGDAPLEAFEGETVSITANTKYGEFISWFSPTEGVVFADEKSMNTTFTMPASDVVLVANFEGTGIHDTEGVTISLYPNPAVDYIQLTGINNGIYTISDMLGNVITKREFIGEAIAVSNLPDGIYILKINNTAIRFIKK